MRKKAVKSLRPTNEDIITHYRKGINENGTCLVCDNPISVQSTKIWHEFRCVSCGTPYEWAGRGPRDEFMQQYGLRYDDIARHYCTVFNVVPVLRAYWQETHTRMPLGDFLGTTQQEEESFYRWLKANADKYEKDFPNDFAWYNIRFQF